MLTKNIFFLIFLFVFLKADLVIGQNTVDSIPASPSRDTALTIKYMLMEMFEVKGIPAVHSRKSCNCGCDIKKEAYIISQIISFASYDFCDSQVFEWIGGEGDPELLIAKVKNGLDALGFSRLNGDYKQKKKFKIAKYLIETSDLLTFMEVSKMKDGSLKLKMSIATP